MAHILISEDHCDTRDLIDLILTADGHMVVSAPDAAHSVLLAAYDQPDLIVMDLGRPWLDGWEATRRLKANPATDHIPVIAFTTHLAQDAIARALSAGCMAVIPKPFQIDDLLHMIAEALAQQVR
jgi:two-component system cell cycle response regulator DivK